eukprot:Hpha_TRINITY_DN16433_c0_g1::TRINITY_DN16433_c0_g1_i2::g.162951::m.162951
MKKGQTGVPSWCIILGWVAVVYSQGNADCSTGNNCICPNNEMCVIECTRANSCQRKTLMCDADYPCDIICTGGQVCKDVSATGFVRSVTCQGRESCEGASISCLGFEGCELECSGESSCENVHISGVEEATCSTRESCGHAVMSCYEGWDCAVTCLHHASCERIDLTCPADQSCRLNCEGRSACKSASMRCPPSVQDPHACYLFCEGDKETCKKMQNDGDIQVVCGSGRDVCKDVTKKGGATHAGSSCPSGAAGSPPDCLECSLEKACSARALTVDPPRWMTSGGCTCNCLSGWGGDDCSQCVTGTLKDTCQWWDTFIEAPVDSGRPGTYMCDDGTFCSAQSCCSSVGVLTWLCPPEKKYMCAMQNDCSSNSGHAKDFCCVSRRDLCDSHGGLRPCETCTGQPTGAPLSPPSSAPTQGPNPPTEGPSTAPMKSPSASPSQPPSLSPFAAPSVSPTTSQPSQAPTLPPAPHSCSDGSHG